MVRHEYESIYIYADDSWLHSSKPHRYLFLLFREPSALDLQKDDVGGEEFVQRRSFKPAEVVKKCSLELVGVNWMNCAADDWDGEFV